MNIGRAFVVRPATEYPPPGGFLPWTDERTKTGGSGRGRAQESGTALPLPLPSSYDARWQFLGTRQPFSLLLGAAVAVMGWAMVLAWTARGCPPRRSGFSWLLLWFRKVQRLWRGFSAYYTFRSGLRAGVARVRGSLSYRFYGISLAILRYR